MRILFVEDNRELAEATAFQIKKAGYEVDCAYDGEEGLYYIENGMYDLLVLDRMMPEIDGIELLKMIRKRGVEIPVLLLTALGGIGDRVDGLDAGADDYLTKPFDIRELLARIRALIRRPAQIADNQAVCFGDLEIDLDALFLKGNKGRCALSKKEAELIGTLMKAEGRTLTRAALFAKAWGPDAEVEESSLDSYAHFIRRRLSAVSSSMLLITVRGIGYRLEGDS